MKKKGKTKMELAAEKLALIGHAFDNPVRVNIIEICIDKNIKNKDKKDEDKEKDYNIRQLAKKLNASYVGIYNHIQVLEKSGLIKTEKQKNVSGQAVTISTDLALFLMILNESNNESYRDILEQYKKGLKDDVLKHIDSSNKKPVSSQEIKKILKEVPLELFLSAYKENFEIYLGRNGKKEEKSK